MATQPNAAIAPSPAGTLDQLLAAIRQLDESARVQVARALLDADLDARMASLIGRLADRQPAEDISDEEIVAEVRAVRTVAAAGRHATHRR